MTEWITHINVSGKKCPVEPADEVVEFEAKLQLLYEHENYCRCMNAKPRTYPDWKMNKKIIHNFSHKSILNEVLEHSKNKPLVEFERQFVQEMANISLEKADERVSTKMTRSQFDISQRNWDICSWFLYLTLVKKLTDDKALEKLESEYILEYDTLRKIISKEKLVDWLDPKWVITVLDKLEGIDIGQLTMNGLPLNCY